LWSEAVAAEVIVFVFVGPALVSKFGVGGYPGGFSWRCALVDCERNHLSLAAGNFAASPI